MTKAEVIWLIIRIAGLYFVYQAVEVAISTFGVLLVAREASREVSDVVSKSAGVLLPAIFRIFLYAGLGIQLLNEGNQFFRLLSRRPDDAGQ